VDIYALGAVLYELLTGRPPFRGESPTETVLQVVHQDPAPPSRLNARVPRDLETICLKCLHKVPGRRYASAQDLAEDLHRFMEGKPVRARPVGIAERALKWARRRPAAALLLTTLLIASVAAVGTTVWLRQQEFSRRRAKAQREERARAAIERALSRADDLRRDARWKEALVHLKDASPHLAEANSPELEQRLQQSQSDYQIADELETTRESYPLLPRGVVDYQQRASEYRTTFDHVGLRIDDDAEAVANFIRGSEIRDQLVAAIEDRAFVALMINDGPLVERLLKIAKLADPGSPWRDRFRDPAVWGKVERLQDLAAGAFKSSPPPLEHQLAILGLLLGRPDAARAFQAPLGHSAPLLAEVCRRQPRNFWAQREMGYVAFRQGQWVQATGYYRVALSLRPDNTGALEGLGIALYHAGQKDEAVATYRRALQLSPKITSVRRRLVDALAQTGYWEEAEAERRAGLEANPAEYLPSHALAQPLFQNGRYEEAAVLVRKVIELAPNDAQAHHYLASYFVKLGQHEDAVREFRRAMELNENNRLTYAHLLANELVALGRFEEAIAALQTAADQEPTNPLYVFEMGRIFRSAGRAEEAAKAFRRAATLVPRYPFVWEELAESLLDQGHFAEARAAIESHLTLGTADALRRAQRRRLDLCNAMLAVEANLPAILAGKEQPTDVPTQLALGELCLKHKRLPATAAGYYASALATQPSLADDAEAGYRLNAARAAALAGCGLGADGARLDDRRRVELRRQALDWLTAEYHACAERHSQGKPADRTVVATAMRTWLMAVDTSSLDWGRLNSAKVMIYGFDVRARICEDLAGVRNEQSLAKLPREEQRDWQALWAKVTKLAGRDPIELFARARTHVARLEWKDAVKCYTEGMALEPTDNADLWFEYAAAQLLAGDRPGYRRACAHMLARCQPAGSMRPYLVARACTLAPDSTDDPTQPFRLSVVELANNREFWAMTQKAALFLREGQTSDAMITAEQSLVADGRPGRAVLNWLWLALAYQKLGNSKEANR
jgi:tetratricopeptide (TPR) repeat protein